MSDQAVSDQTITDQAMSDMTATAVMPQDLKNLQLEFAQALTTPGEQPELYQQIQDSHFDADQLLQIYRNNFVLSLTESLEITFPVLRVMVGEEFFAQLAKAFIRQVPMEKAAVAEFGDLLPEFMANLEQLSEIPYLVDLARFEWAYSVRINRMPQAEPFPYQALAELSEDDYERMSFSVNPDLTLFQSQWAIIELFQRLKNWLVQREACCAVNSSRESAANAASHKSDSEQTEDDPLAGLQLDQPQQGYIATTGLAEVEYQVVGSGIFVLLEHCQQSQLFNQFEHDDAEALLQQGISSGLITGFILRPESGV